MLAPLGHVRVWRFSLYYFLVFGGYVALSLWLPKYYMDVYGFDLRTAALLTAMFVFPSGIIRAPGGLALRPLRRAHGHVLGARHLRRRLRSCSCSRTCSSPSASPSGTRRPASTMHLSLRVGPALFTALVFVLGLAMGIGKAAVYKHIPHYFPDRVGAVGGLVGVIGGLGGFVMPILFGALAQWTRVPTTTFMFLFAVSLGSLAWMVIVVRRVTRAAAPRVAEELDSGSASRSPAPRWLRAASSSSPSSCAGGRSAGARPSQRAASERVARPVQPWTRRATSPIRYLRSCCCSRARSAASCWFSRRCSPISLRSSPSSLSALISTASARPPRRLNEAFTSWPRLS